jgi:glucokinase
MKAFAVDLGGSHATCALIEDQAILDSREVPTDGALGLGPFLPHIGETLKALLSYRPGTASDPAGLAFGFCGLVDYSNCRILSTNAKYDDGPGLDLGAWCRETLGHSPKNGQRCADGSAW